VLARPELNLEGGEFQSWSGSAFRHVAPSFDPLSTRGSELHGGRWNQRGTPALYLALSEDTALAEFERLAAQRAQSRDAFLPRNLAVLRVGMESILVAFPGNFTGSDRLELVEVRDSGWDSP
jgi:RES domain-containing protein